MGNQFSCPRVGDDTGEWLHGSGESCHINASDIKKLNHTWWLSFGNGQIQIKYCENVVRDGDSSWTDRQVHYIFACFWFCFSLFTAPPPFPQCHLSKHKQTLTPKKDGFCSRFLPVKQSFYSCLYAGSRSTSLYSLDQQVWVFRQLIGQTVHDWWVGTKTCSHPAVCGIVRTSLL